MRTYAFNMVGLPGEDMKAVLDTVKLNAESKPSQIQTSIFYPYPGTDLHQLCLKQGHIVQGKTVESYFEDTILELNTITREQILFARAYFDLLVRLYTLINGLPKAMRRAATKVMDKVICSSLLPYPALLAMRPLLSPKLLLRSKLPRLYGFIRPYYKRVQYRTPARTAQMSGRNKS